MRNLWTGALALTAVLAWTCAPLRAASTGTVPGPKTSSQCVGDGEDEGGCPDLDVNEMIEKIQELMNEHGMELMQDPEKLRELLKDAGLPDGVQIEFGSGDDMGDGEWIEELEDCDAPAAKPFDMESFMKVQEFLFALDPETLANPEKRAAALREAGLPENVDVTLDENGNVTGIVITEASVEESTERCPMDGGCDESSEYFQALKSGKDTWSSPELIDLSKSLRTRLKGCESCPEAEPVMKSIRLQSNNAMKSGDECDPAELEEMVKQLRSQLKGFDGTNRNTDRRIERQVIRPRVIQQKDGDLDSIVIELESALEGLEDARDGLQFYFDDADSDVFLQAMPGIELMLGQDGDGDGCPMCGRKWDGAQSKAMRFFKKNDGADIRKETKSVFKAVIERDGKRVEFDNSEDMENWLKKNGMDAPQIQVRRIESLKREQNRQQDGRDDLRKRVDELERLLRELSRDLDALNR